MKLATATVLASLTTACTLDPATKAYREPGPSDGGQVGSLIVMGERFVARAPGVTTGDILANDRDTRDRPIEIIATDPGLTMIDAETAQCAIAASGNISFGYTVSNGEDTARGTVVVTGIPDTVELAATTEYATYLDKNLSYIPATMLEIAEQPAHGHVGDAYESDPEFGDQVLASHFAYMARAGFCGDDVLTLRIKGDNGALLLPVTVHVTEKFATGVATVAYPGPARLDMVADGEQLEIDSISNIQLNDWYETTPSIDVPPTFASISDDTHALLIAAPAAMAQYKLSYTARKPDGCLGYGALYIYVDNPTSVLVGAGQAGDTLDPEQSQDGRYVAFTSSSSTLVADDTNGVSDVFVLDTQTNLIERVSIGTAGTQANGASTSATISSDGRFVAFVSKATNLSPLDTTAIEDVYLHDRTTGETKLVSISLDAAGSNQPSLTPHISADAARVVFASSATRLVTGDTNGVADIFVRDLPTSTTTCQSVDTSGNQLSYASLPRPRISGNGRYVVLAANGPLDAPASTVAGTFVVDTTSGSVTRVSNTTGPFDIDASGDHISYGDAFGVQAVYDMVLESSTPITSGAWPALSSDGSCASVITNTEVVARCAGDVAVVSLDADGAAVPVTPLRRPSISGDGRWIVFATDDWPGEAGHYVLVRVWNRSLTR